MIWVVTEFPGTSRPDRRPVVSCGQCIALDACQVFRNPSRKFYAAFVNGTIFRAPLRFGGRIAQKSLLRLKSWPKYSHHVVVVQGHLSTRRAYDQAAFYPVTRSNNAERRLLLFVLIADHIAN